MTSPLPHLTQLESAGLVRLARAHPELEYRFRHALVQDAAYDSLLKADRRRFHRAVGEALERLYPERLDEIAPALERHFNEAGDDERALRYATLAGDSAFGRSASQEAVFYYRRALALRRWCQICPRPCVTASNRWRLPGRLACPSNWPIL